MKARKQAMDRLKPVETVGPKRHQRDAGGRIETAVQGQKLQALAIAELVELIAVTFLTIGGGLEGIGLRLCAAVRRKPPREAVQDNDAGILLRQPKHPGIW